MGLFTTPLKIDISEIINPTPVEYKLTWAHEVKLQYAQKYANLKMMAKTIDEMSSSELRARQKQLQETIRKGKDTDVTAFKNELILINKILKEERDLLNDIKDVWDDISDASKKQIKNMQDTFKFEKAFTSGVEKRLKLMKDIKGVDRAYVDSLKDAAEYQEDTIHNWTKTLKLSKDLTETQRQIAKIQGAINVAIDKGDFSEAQILKKQQQKLKLINAVEATGRAINKGLELSKKLWGDIQKIAGMLKGVFNALLSPLKAMDEIFGGVLSNAMRLVMNPLALLGTMVGLAVARMEKFNQITVDISRQFGIQGAQLQKMDGIAKGLYEQYRDMGVELEQMPEYINAALEGMGNLDLVTRKNTEMILQMNKGWGVSTSAAGEFVGMMSKMTGQGDKGAQNMMNLAKAMSDAKGIPVAKVIEDVANASDEAFGFMSGMPNKMIATAVEARRLGMSLEGVAKLSRGLLNVQESIGAEMEASIMTGKNLNFNAARRMALEGDLIGAQNEVMKQLGGIEEFNKMDILQKEAIAKATGMSVKDLAKTLEQREQEEKLAKEREEREKRMNQLIDKGLNLFTKITSISEKWAHFFENIKKILAEAIMPYVERTMKYLLVNMHTIEAIVKNFINKLFMPLFKMVFDFGKQILEIFGIKFEKGPGDILQKINKTILSWGYLLETKIKPKLQEILEKYIKPIFLWIKETAIQVKDWLFKEGGWEKIKVTFEKIVNAAKSLWEALGKILEKLGVKSTGKGITGVLDTVLNIVQKIADYVKDNPFKSLFALSMLKFDGLRGVLMSLTGLVAKGGFKMISSLFTKGAGEGGLMSSISGGLKNFLNIGSKESLTGGLLKTTGAGVKGFMADYKSIKELGGIMKYGIKDSFTELFGSGSKLMGQGAGKLAGSMGVVTSALMGGKDIYDIATSNVKSGERNKEVRESFLQVGTGSLIGGIAAALGTGPVGFSIGYAIGDTLGGVMAKNENVNKMLDAMDLEGVIDKFQTNFKTFGSNISDIWNDETLSFGEKAGKILKETLILMWENFKLYWTTIFKTLISGDFWIALGGAIFDGLKALLYDIPKWISTFLADMVRGIFGYEKGGEIDKIMNKVFLVITNPFAAIIDAIVESWDTIKAVFKAGWDFIDKYFIQPIVKMYNIVKNIIETINNYIEGAFWYIYGAIIKPVVDLIQAEWQKISDFFSPYLEAIKNTFMSVWNTINENVISPITKGITYIGEKIGSLWDSISNFFGNMKNGFMDWAKSIANALMELPGIKQVKWLWDKTSELLSGAEETTGQMKSSSESFKEAGMKYAGVKDALIRVNDTVIRTADKDQILATTDMQGMLQTVSEVGRTYTIDELTKHNKENKELMIKLMGQEANPYLKIISDVLSKYFDEEMNTFKKNQIASMASQPTNTYMGGIVNAAGGLQLEQSAINRGIGGAVPGKDKAFYNANLGVYMHTGETVAKTASGGMAVLNRDQQRLLAAGGHTQFMKNMAEGGTLSREQIAGYAKNAGFPDNELPMAVAIALAESGGRPGINNRGVNKNGTVDYGLWQINTVHNPKEPDIYDPSINAGFAHRIWAARNSWTPWSTFKNKAYERYLSGVTPAAVGGFVAGVSSAAGWLMSMIPGMGIGTDTGTGPSGITGAPSSTLTAMTGDVTNPSAVGVTPANRPIMKFFFDRMQNAMKATGHNFDGWGSRSAADQVRLKAEKGKWAATPGRSRHEWGLAVDVKPGYWRSQKDDTELMKYGLWRPLLNSGSTPEPWHIEPLGQGGGRVPLDAGAAARKVLENMSSGGVVMLNYKSENEGDAPPPEVSKAIVKSPVNDAIIKGNTITPINSADGGVLGTDNGVIAQSVMNVRNEEIALLREILNAVKANRAIEVTKLRGVEG